LHLFLQVVSKKIEPPPALEIQGLKAVSINTFCPIGQISPIYSNKLIIPLHLPAYAKNTATPENQSDMAVYFVKRPKKYFRKVSV